NDAIMGDQPINGQLWGANPVWIVLDFAEGGQCKIKHTFNVQQSIERDSEHFIHVEPWIVDINIGALVGAPLTFVGSATDPGSDDLTFTWNWGDGSNVTTTTYYYDPSRVPPNDPDPSPYEPYFGGTTPPLNVQDTQTHAYSSPGTYVVTLTVTDDDGGSATVTTTITVGEGDICPTGGGGGGRGANQGELALLQITAWEYNVGSGTVGSDDVVTFPDGTEMTASEALDYLMDLYDNGEYGVATEIADHLNNEYGHSIGYWGLVPGRK
ncbi:MAG: PKD domain-containing protein, partial [Thermoplasmata archaeon]